MSWKTQSIYYGTFFSVLIYFFVCNNFDLGAIYTMRDVFVCVGGGAGLWGGRMGHCLQRKLHVEWRGSKISQKNVTYYLNGPFPTSVKIKRLSALFILISLFLYLFS